MTLDVDTLRRRLTRVLEKTVSAATGDVATGCFVGDKAAERRLRDNADAGRLEWRAAHNRARLGLETLDAVARAREALLVLVEGEDYAAMDAASAEIETGLDLARAALGQAEGLYAAALEAHASPADIVDLGKSAVMRGREPSPAIADRDRRLAEGVDRLRAADPTLTGKAARTKALDDDPSLAEAFRGHSEATLRQALRRKNG